MGEYAFPYLNVFKFYVFEHLAYQELNKISTAIHFLGLGCFRRYCC